MSLLRPQPLSVQLALASLVSVVGLVIVCGVGVVSLQQLSSSSSAALRGEMDLFDNMEGLQSLLYQKGFVAYYMLSGDRTWLTELDRSRQDFSRWLQQARTYRGGGTGERDAQQLLVRIASEYAAYDASRNEIINLFNGGAADAAKSMMSHNHEHGQMLLKLCQEFSRLGHTHAQRDLILSQNSLQKRTGILLLASIGGTLASLAMGFLLARRVAKPIYELQLQVESAVQKTRLSVPSGRAGMEAIGEHVAALLNKLEETDATILEHRQRLIQNEKMSAIGEVAAKLAHEILNPLAGMKAAVQLLLRNQGHASAAEIQETSLALDHEITRVDQLVRRLVNYVRPLAPRLEPILVGRLLDSVAEAARTQLVRHEVQLVRDEAEGLPEFAGDPLLLTQALVNLVLNAVQVSPPGGSVTIAVRRLSHLGREHLSFKVIDGGAGIRPEHQARLFHPFFTTKLHGHGLGLAITQNIVMEHGGHISASNREGSPGAVFEVLLPTETQA